MANPPNTIDGGFGNYYDRAHSSSSNDDDPWSSDAGDSDNNWNALDGDDVIDIGDGAHTAIVYGGNGNDKIFGGVALANEELKLLNEEVDTEIRALELAGAA